MDFFRYSQGEARQRLLSRMVWVGEPIEAAADRRLAHTLKSRLGTLLNYCKWPITNAASEALNSKIQWIKYTARGFRSREGFRRAIYFPLRRPRTLPTEFLEEPFFIPRTNGGRRIEEITVIEIGGEESTTKTSRRRVRFVNEWLRREDRGGGLTEGERR